MLQASAGIVEGNHNEQQDQQDQKVHPPIEPFEPAHLIDHATLYPSIACLPEPLLSPLQWNQA